MDHDLEIPSYFRCPISMELMTDPVTVETGITYDRASIEQWMYTCNKKKCPVTMLELQNVEFTPNHTLWRLIQGWCMANSVRSVDPIPTPTPPVDQATVSELLNKALGCPSLEVSPTLKKIRSLVRENPWSLRCISVSVPLCALFSILESHCREEMEMDVCEQILGILNLLPVTQEGAILLSKSPAIKAMALVLQRGSTEARLHAVTLLQTVAAHIPDWEAVIRREGDILERIVEVIKDDVCHQATVASLDVLMAICAYSRMNKINTVEVGASNVLVEMLSEADSWVTCEKILDMLDKLLEIPEGRAAFADHEMGVAAVSKKIMRVSDCGTRKAVRILWSLCVSGPRASVLRDMIQFGAVSKMCLLLQLGCSPKTKQKAKEVLKVFSIVY